MQCATMKELIRCRGEGVHGDEVRPLAHVGIPQCMIATTPNCRHAKPCSSHQDLIKYHGFVPYTRFLMHTCVYTSMGILRLIDLRGSGLNDNQETH